MGIELSLEISLGSKDILAVLSLVIHEHRLSIYVCFISFLSSMYHCIIDTMYHYISFLSLMFYSFFGCCCCFFAFLSFLGLHQRHMEVPRLGVESELYPPAYARAAAMWDLIRVCDLQLTATPDPQPTEQGQGMNPQPHGSQLDSLTTAP